MLSLLQLVVAQTATPESVDPLAQILTTVVGGGSSAGLTLLAVQWIISRRNAPKNEAAQAEKDGQIRDIVDRLRETAQIQRETLKEIEESRRESREAHRVMGEQLRGRP